MLLSARIITDVQNANSYEHTDVAEISEGDNADIWFQLVDISLDKSLDGFQPAGRRYITAAGATLQCVIENINDAKVITRYATAPFAGDTSMWKISVLSSDGIRGTSNLRLTLTEDTSIKHGVVKNGIRIHPNSCLG
jgi:hypothetical protein